MDLSIYEKKWTRRMLNYLWVAVTMAIFSPVVNIFFTEFQRSYYLVYRVALPAAVTLSMMLFAEFLVAKLPKYKDYILILHTLLISISLMLIHDTIPMVLLSLFLMPIFMAAITFHRQKITFALIISLCAFIAFLLWYPPYGDFTQIMIINFLFLICSVYYLSIQITAKGKEIIQKLEASLENEKDLFMKNVVMEKMSKIDLPTDLYNHKTFHEYLHPLLEQLENQEFPLYLALLDLDDFKSVNDTYGHSTGDRVIQQTATLIKEHLGSDDFGARYGGEEFGIIFTDKEPAEVYQLLESLRTSMADHGFPDMEHTSVTLSVGLAEAVPGEDKDTLFQRADRYLYEAKQQGKNRISTGTSTGTAAGTSTETSTDTSDETAAETSDTTPCSVTSAP
ncbi:GGDEF domain-containing protein [Isachenkonia alkalipeptolytica]|uniref:Diguanylate cyclase n=1 Tax=Isachenkonia alkalipeptolytica TaxID=2565777 RepID=A0AA44BEN3_9CLOT|nr:GGDEF domain-containing protein [Isachenkonia alkalipeptolytica]NBG88365.1 diguanylate cyclase [Isachenkonia alkalipeptolytica]